MTRNADNALILGLYDTDYTDGFAIQVPGEAYPRIHITADGSVKTGDGTAPPTELSGGGTFGTTAGTYAEGNDSRITGAAQKSANLSDLASASTARTNLGLGTAATTAATAYATAAQGTTADGAAQKSANLSDLSSASTARTNLGLGTAATTAATAYAAATHASTHASGGSDAVTLAQSQVTNLTTDLSAKATSASPSFTGQMTVGGTTVHTARAFTVSALSDEIPCDASLVRITNSAGAGTMTGKVISTTGAVDGQMLTLQFMSTATLTLNRVNTDANSKIRGSGNIAMNQYDIARFMYDSTSGFWLTVGVQNNG